ncbi:hypothetical protein CBF34_08425 [Vagococcus penaei]|uniref:Uncharacterized protein n=1 Tax=Vagococcus penaei TaxID=633807 RepID=A0A1Q2D611_9ENTE|nr:EutP/PduV family microcompartment system protein [Vagococcus penaei]AQP53764.1 hypothetical protein BW732_05605 [Vagococcus penaei]RSU00405.1 hypothetical protein CBF34_08425 [Vagococcus penaei]
MIKKRILLIGTDNSGKARLASQLNCEMTEVKNRASLVYGKETIIVPETYLASPWMHKHIISLQQSVNLVVMIWTDQQTRKIYPPQFAKAFTKPVIGMISSQEATISKETLDLGEKNLQSMGVKQPYIVWSLDDQAQLKTVAQFILERREELINGKF